VGKELLKQLMGKGGAPAKVRAAYQLRPPGAAGVEPVRIDLSTGEGLDAALAGCRAMFLLSGGLADQQAHLAWAQEFESPEVAAKMRPPERDRQRAGPRPATSAARE
jgi:hypothetical protein